jgi:hypothetical protein
MIGMQLNVGVAEALLAICPDAQFAVRDDDYDKIEWHSPDVEVPTREEIEAKIEELKAVAPTNSLRQIRNFLLTESDWTQAQDIRAIRGEEWCAAWDSYRQELRDITEAGFDLSFNEMGILDGFTLPDKPAA